MNKNTKLDKVKKELKKLKSRTAEATVVYRDLEAEKLATKLNIGSCSYVYAYQFDNDEGFLATAIVLADENKVLKEYAIVVKGEDYDNEELFNSDDDLNQITKNYTLYEKLESLYFEEVLSLDLDYLSDYIIYC